MSGDRDQKQKKHILIIENDPLVAYALTRALRTDQVSVHTQELTDTAIESINDRVYDLFLIGLHHRDFSRRDMIHLVGLLCTQAQLIVMTTGYLDTSTLDKSVQSAVELGVCYLVAKPFNIFEVSEMVGQLLTTSEVPCEGYLYVIDSGGRKKRLSIRKHWVGEVSLEFGVISGGRNKRRSFRAKTTDISDTGIGLTTHYPLKSSQVVSFGEDIQHRSGIVVWSEMINEHTCRAGVKFG